MKKIITAIVFMVFCFCPYLARADTNQLAASCLQHLPNFSNWTVVSMIRIKLIVSDTTVAYLGVKVEYKNPNDPNEFMVIISRHIPLIISKQQNPNEQLLSQVMVTFDNNKDKQDRLNQLTQKADPITYIHWRVKTNEFAGISLQDGDVTICFLSPDENWLLIKNQPIQVEFLTENVGNSKSHNVFTGMKYQIGNVYHIVRLDRSDLIQLLEGEKQS